MLSVLFLSPDWQNPFNLKTESKHHLLLKVSVTLQSYCVISLCEPQDTVHPSVGWHLQHCAKLWLNCLVPSLYYMLLKGRSHISFLFAALVFRAYQLVIERMEGGRKKENLYIHKTELHSCHTYQCAFTFK